MITIKTRLDDAIYRSQGGGQTITHYSWKTGPRNLIKAAAAFWKHKDEMEEGYGEIGAGQSWVEVDGMTLDRMDLWSLNPTFWSESSKGTATKQAWDIINRVAYRKSA